jgi:NDP-sugar pyrophosphorylase family protein
MAGSLADVTGAILAGGLGTRLRSMVADRPKVLAPVHGRPYLTYLLDQLADAGLREVVLLTGYRSDQVQLTFGEAYGDLHLIYSPEPSPLGTAGALRWALPKLSSPSLLVLNGDSYCDVSLMAFWSFHNQHSADLSLVLTQVADTSRFGKVHLAADERVLRYEEKQTAGGAGWINAGIYLVNRSLIEGIPSGRPVSLEREMFPLWASNKKCRGFRGATRFLDIGTPESYLRAEAFFSTGQAA